MILNDHTLQIIKITAYQSSIYASARLLASSNKKNCLHPIQDKGSFKLQIKCKRLTTISWLEQLPLQEPLLLQ